MAQSSVIVKGKSFEELESMRVDYECTIANLRLKRKELEKERADILSFGGFDGDGFDRVVKEFNNCERLLVKTRGDLEKVKRAESKLKGMHHWGVAYQ